IHILEEGLTEHALPVTGVAGFRWLGIFVRDRQAAIVAGVVGTINWNWLSISLFWVSEPLRRSGFGRRLLNEIEQIAIGRGCTHAHLDTFSYQARPFYERHGYEVFGVLDDYPPGHQRFFMRKKLLP